MESSSPRISIVTPSFNQGRFLEQTILSVLTQGYTNLEYIVVDGGSTDDSVEIIRRYEHHLAYWVSEPDKGQSQAINKGFALATGEIFAWLNSDDRYAPGSLQAVVEAFAVNPQAGVVVGAGEYVDERGNAIRLTVPGDISLESIYAWFDGYFWQPSCFFTREAWRECGPLDEALEYAMDLDLWLKMAKKFRFASIGALLSTSLKHPGAKSTAHVHTSDQVAMEVIVKQGGVAGVLAALDSYSRRLLSYEPYYQGLLAERDARLAERDRLVAEQENLIALREREAAQRAGEIAAMRQSISWRITKPLRWLWERCTQYR